MNLATTPTMKPTIMVQISPMAPPAYGLLFNHQDTKTPRGPLGVLVGYSLAWGVAQEHGAHAGRDQRVGDLGLGNDGSDWQAECQGVDAGEVRAQLLTLEIVRNKTSGGVGEPLVGRRDIDIGHRSAR